MMLTVTQQPKLDEVLNRIRGWTSGEKLDLACHVVASLLEDSTGLSLSLGLRNNLENLRAELSKLTLNFYDEMKYEALMEKYGQ